MNADDRELRLHARNVVKTFPGVRALSNATLKLRAGEIHALMGENGAGKSTLIKVIAGVHGADGGSIELDGRPISPKSVGDAERMGISTVFQEVNLVPMLSVAENITLGRFPKRFGLISWRSARHFARDALASLGLNIDVCRPLNSYSIAIQQMVAITRAVRRLPGEVPTRVLILDEPTSSLDTGEVRQLFKVMRSLRESGLAILFVTHFLDQVYEVSDRITVLRNGSFVGEYLATKLPKLQLVSAMLGREFSDAREQLAHEHAGKTERKTRLRAAALGKRGSVEFVDFTVGEGETLGLAGLLGSGRTETVRLIFGVDKPDTGRLELDGKPVKFDTPRTAMNAGLAMTPEDRKADGIIPNLSIRENIVLALQSRRGIWRRVGEREQRELADRFIAALRIKTPSDQQLIRNLSGGNQQKVLLARWLATNPKLLILDEPTRGIDVGAKAEIEKLVRDLCAAGMSVIFISSELEEVADVSDRIVVLRDRRQVGELDGRTASVESIMQMIAGAAPAAPEAKP